MSVPKKQALWAVLLVVVGLAISVPIGVSLYAGGIRADETGTSGQFDTGMAVLGLIGLALAVIGAVVALAACTLAARMRRGID